MDGAGLIVTMHAICHWPHRPAAGTRPSLDDRVSLEHELERLLERDVDVIDAAELGEELRPMIEADEVRLYGRP